MVDYSSVEEARWPCSFCLGHKFECHLPSQHKSNDQTPTTMISPYQSPRDARVWSLGPDSSAGARKGLGAIRR